MREWNRRLTEGVERNREINEDREREGRRGREREVQRQREIKGE